LAKKKKRKGGGGQSDEVRNREVGFTCRGAGEEKQMVRKTVGEREEIRGADLL